MDDLAQWNRQFGYQPWIWEMLGRLLLQRGERFAAGRALFWANVRGGDEQSLVDAFVEHVRGRPERLVGSLPPRCRQPLASWPEPLRIELHALGVTDRLLDRSRRRNVPGPLLWPLVLFVLVALAVGGFQILAACWQWLSSLWG